ncbi:MAG: valine--tRNA ligase, partial [Gemmatimonadales bacterium]
MTAVNLAPQYDPSSIESTIYQKWLEADVFTARADESKEPFVIVIPPPNVTGVLHMGHGLNNTVQDVLIRFQRMRGRDALWLPGTDHAGIATQNVVERLLADEGKKKEDLGREKFVERVWQHVNETGGTILDQLKAIGCSCDWSRTRFTFDEGLSRAVREVFVALYEKGLIYRGKYIINWCPRCRTALSNEEAEKKDTEGKLWHLRYPIVGDAGGDPTGIVVATTRPETMLGDTAVAVHPDDERYGSVVGKTVRLPLANRDIPIIADRGVDPEFGTGAVKVTPAHDPLDFEIALRHDLEALNILTDDALLNDNVPEPYRGMTVVAARTQVVEDLEAAGVMLDVAQHSHSVGRCYRCDTIVEPRLSDQWFVKMKPLAEPALQAYEQGRIGFVPQRMGDDFVRWLNEIRDWCISRQLWWGHRIPAWYCGDCDKIIVSREDPTECDCCGAGALTRDPDVLDTWFSSWLWPFSTFGWPERTDDLARYYPGTVLVTARDIIFFWVSRMIMAGLEFMGDVPFKTVVFNGVVRDAQHRKMSKSLGNGIDPLDVVRRFGADALRFTVIHAGAPGTDIPL